MNLQERLERMLEDRRGYVVGHDRAKLTETLHELLPLCAEGALMAENQNERDNWLVRLCGLALYVMHPEDERTGGELVVAGLDHNGEPAGLPSPAPAGQRVRVLDPDRVMVADGKGGWQTISDGTQVPFEDEREVPFTVHRRKGGGLRRKPRPDRKP